VENEISLGCVFLGHLSDLSIEVLEVFNVGVQPWLVDGLESSKGAMASPSLKETLSDIERPLNVDIVDMFHLTITPWSHPFGFVVWPVSEIEATLIPNNKCCFS
jgi:hypothetical protein